MFSVKAGLEASTKLEKPPPWLEGRELPRILLCAPGPQLASKLRNVFMIYLLNSSFDSE